MPSGSVHCCVTSPPFWGLRDYSRCQCSQHYEDDESTPTEERNTGSVGGPTEKNFRQRLPNPNCPICKGTGIIEGVKEHQLGLEKTPEEYVQHLVEVFREVKRVLRDDGTFWLNLGDSYWGGGLGHSNQTAEEFQEAYPKQGSNRGLAQLSGQERKALSGLRQGSASALKPKDLVGIPWMVARALQSPYYTGTIKNERDRIWLAALLETEGTICGFYHIRKDDSSPRTGVHLHITNCDQRLLDEAVRIFPSSAKLVHLRSTESHLGKRDVYRWHVFSIKGKKQLIAELYPYLIAKRKQAVVAWNLLDLMENAKHLGHTSQKDGVRDLRKQMVEILSNLNSGVDIVLPEWMKEPPSLYEEGWYLRSDIIWSKPNPMPESVTDRPTKSHEYIFLLTKSSTYFYDQEAIREGISDSTMKRWHGNPYTPVQNEGYNPYGTSSHNPDRHKGEQNMGVNPAGRNKRSVWTMNTKPFSGAHFAVFPPELPETCIKAGTSQKGCCPKCGASWERVIERDNPSLWSKDDDWRGWPTDGPNANTTNPQTSKSLHRQKGGVYPSGKFLGWRPTCSCGLTDTIPCTVIDPFAGSGTTGMVAKKLGRSTILIELNPVYIDMVGIRTGIGVKEGPLDRFPDEETIEEDTGEGKMTETDG